MRLTHVGWRLVAAAVISIAGCNDAKPKKATAPAPAEVELTGDYQSSTEREYARLAYNFAKALQSGDYDAAYKLGSSHLQSRIKVADLERTETQSKKEFGLPLRLYSDPVVNTTGDLKGPGHVPGSKENVTASLKNMKAMRAVGEIPESVPVGIRRASVRVEIERDPYTIPDFQSRTGITPDDLTDQDRVVSYLTAVIIEENRVLGVAYFYHRWPDIWDEQLTPGTMSAEDMPENKPARSVRQ
jgi:hypothetical protein